MRALLVVSLVACSSPTKQPAESSPPAPSTVAAPAVAPDAAAAADPWQAAPANPDADLAALRADVEIICRAAKETNGTTWIEVGPHIAESMKTVHKVALFADHRNATLDDFIERIRGLMAKANVTSCDTLDVLIANDPRKRN